VFFRQIRDKNVKRGYFQKSVVLLSKFPYMPLFSYILDLIAPEYFLSGIIALETVSKEISKWPPPSENKTLSLAIMGQTLEITVPDGNTKFQIPIVYKKEYPTVPIVLPSVYDINLYKCLRPVLNHIHLLWELVILNEPILVIASVPDVCSEFVSALINLTWPIKYSSDYRPFFTIHNSEFQEYSMKSSPIPSVIIGVTNPFFSKSLQHWPNIIKISDQNDLNNDKNSTSKINKTSNIKIIDTKTVVYSKYETFLEKDKTIIKKLLKGSETNRPSEAQSLILLRHFTEITQSFVIPLEQYFTSLLPLKKSISPFKSVPKIKEFKIDEFVSFFNNSTPKLSHLVKGDWVGFYRKFFHTSNFKNWLQQKESEVEKKLAIIHLESLCEYDVSKWLKDKQEIEIIDQYIHLREKLELLEKFEIALEPTLKDKLYEILKIILDSLPNDIQILLKK